MRREHWMSIAIGVVFILLWEAWVRMAQPSALVLPAPSVIAQSLWQGLASGYLWPHIVSSTRAEVLGLSLIHI